MPGLAVTVSPAGTAAELFSCRLERDRNLARSSHDGMWVPGVVTVDVGAVENPLEDSDARDVPNDAPLPELVEFRDMHDIEPFPVPLYVLALAALILKPNPNPLELSPAWKIVNLETHITSFEVEHASVYMCMHMYEAHQR